MLETNISLKTTSFLKFFDPFLALLKIVFLNLNIRNLFQAVLTADVDLLKFDYHYFSSFLIVFYLFVKKLTIYE